MPKVHNHYDNLKVARTASPEEIRAAYRGLTRKHHPDRNPDNADAERVMAVINVAYDVLSDPVKRSEHDRWIAQAEAAHVRAARPVRSRPTVHAPTDRYRYSPDAFERAQALRLRQVRAERRVRHAVAHLTRHRIAYGLAAVAALCLAAVGLSALRAPDLPSATAMALAASTRHVAGYARAASAPNGERWPRLSGYIDGYGQMNKDGQSNVTVENAHNDTDMFVKLYSLDGPTAVPVRTFFVAARGRFTLDALTAGTYDLRYRNLASGELSRSAALIIEEVVTPQGKQHSAIGIKLYKSVDANMQAYSLGDADF